MNWLQAHLVESCYSNFHGKHAYEYYSNLMHIIKLEQGPEHVKPGQGSFHEEPEPVVSLTRLS
jgi:hypothetical protein